MSRSDLVRSIRTMRVVRRFSAERIPDDVLDDILEVGRWTGSSKNTQPWEIVVVRDRVMLAALAKLGQFAGHIDGAQADLVPVLNSASNAFDGGRLVERLMLAAWAHGVGSCIGSIFPDENMRRAMELLGIPQDRWLRATVALGYPADANATRVSSTPAMSSVLPMIGRKPMRELVSWERYGRREPS